MNKFAHAYLTKLAALKEKEETRASKVLKGGLTGAAIGGLGLGAAGAINGTRAGLRYANKNPLSDEQVAEVNRDLKKNHISVGTEETAPPQWSMDDAHRHQRLATGAATGAAGGLMGTAAGVVGGGALGVLYGMIR